MPLYLVGLGLGDEKDITVKGLETVRQCDKVYLEAYTSILLSHQVGDASQLSEFYGKEVIVADREAVESGDILDGAKELKVALLVVGDPFGATTHSDLVVRCKEQGIECNVIHNATIMSAIGACGLQLYRYGQAVSICFWTDSWRPDSWFEKLEQNAQLGLHTLLLLDIKVKEQSIENMARGRKVYEPPRFMTVQQCAEQTLEILESKPDSVIKPETRAVGLARVGAPDQMIVSGTIRELAEMDFGEPLHSMVICGDVHEAEEEHLAIYYTESLQADYKKRMEALRAKYGQ
eukprot:TRINITY_DN12111_c0_g1_i1.p1 TRINITY_DN12111_c0_g1~~TRINITY_DN12111_c0_g1_i1.p1  ORF type:complete len:291 (+),score=129.79 TRINITY_DN12111_c0_g1_i1:261-1133(+)